MLHLPDRRSTSKMLPSAPPANRACSPASNATQCNGTCVYAREQKYPCRVARLPVPVSCVACRPVPVSCVACRPVLLLAAVFCPSLGSHVCLVLVLRCIPADTPVGGCVLFQYHVPCLSHPSSTRCIPADTPVGGCVLSQPWVACLPHTSVTVHTS